MFGEWQPIETSPKDGTHVLLFEAGQPGEPCVGWWMQGEWRDRGDIGCDGQEDYTPTHWMPLPLKPQ
jgi:hypothetical protein